LFAGNKSRSNKNIKLVSVVIKKVLIRNTVLLLFKGFSVYVESEKQIIININMLLRIFGSKME